MRMSDCETMDDILSEFANRDPAGYVVWGQKILAAHNRECKQLNAEIEAMSKFNDSLNAQMKECDAKYDKLRALVKEIADAASQNMKSQCFHCDLKYACHEGEDGLVIPCSKVTKLRDALKKSREVCKGANDEGK